MSEEKIKYRVRCPRCGKERDIEVTEEGVRRFSEGEPIQKCFPELSPDDREGLVTGICPECWNLMFPDD